MGVENTMFNSKIIKKRSLMFFLLKEYLPKMKITLLILSIVQLNTMDVKKQRSQYIQREGISILVSMESFHIENVDDISYVLYNLIYQTLMHHPFQKLSFPCIEFLFG